MVTAWDLMTRDFLSVQSTDSLSKVIGQLITRDVRTALVFNGKKYIGIIDRDLLLVSKLDSTTAKAGNFIKHPPQVSLNEELQKCAELMYGAYPCVLPVKRDNDIIGVIRAKDIIKTIEEIPVLARQSVVDVMTHELIVFDHNARLGDAINIMNEKKISRVPVVDSQGRVTSVFSLTDSILKTLSQPLEKEKGSGSRGNFFPKSYNPSKHFMLSTNIGDVASMSVITCNPSEKLGKAVEEMLENNISDIIIAENQKPVGIITEKDLLRAFVLLKEPELWKMQFMGLNNLKPFQADAVREIVAEHYEKLKRDFFKEQPRYFFTEIKEYEEPGKNKRIKYSVHIRLAMPSHVFSTEQASFDLNTAVSYALKEMSRVVQDFKEKFRDRWRGGSGESKGFYKQQDRRNRRR